MIKLEVLTIDFNVSCSCGEVLEEDESSQKGRIPVLGGSGCGPIIVKPCKGCEQNVRDEYGD